MNTEDQLADTLLTMALHANTVLWITTGTELPELMSTHLGISHKIPFLLTVTQSFCFITH